MLPIIVQAAENFCLHQLSFVCQSMENINQKRTLLAYIDIETDEGVFHRAYVGCDYSLVQVIAEIFLGENTNDEQTLIDMLLEITNMIVGSAKVLAAEAYEKTMLIATPFFVLDNSVHTTFDSVHHLGIENGAMMLALKRL
ncbi:MAG: chemotaxis protein CheX [Sulfuricurvum sp.]|nr:chemotaxis protein CheX [Sulfuricurvum sp.]